MKIKNVKITKVTVNWKSCLIIKNKRAPKIFNSLIKTKRIFIINKYYLKCFNFKIINKTKDLKCQKIQWVLFIIKYKLIFK